MQTGFSLSIAFSHSHLLGTTSLSTLLILILSITYLSSFVATFHTFNGYELLLLEQFDIITASIMSMFTCISKKCMHFMMSHTCIAFLSFFCTLLSMIFIMPHSWWSYNICITWCSRVSDCSIRISQSYKVP